VVRSEPSADGMRVIITDSGCGFPEQLMQHAF
jgi:hypothetical protein